MAETVNRHGRRGVSHRGTAGTAMSNMPVYTATHSASTMPMTVSTVAMRRFFVAKPGHFRSMAASMGRVTTMAVKAKNTSANSAAQAPNAIHEVWLLKLCHSRRPRAGAVSSESSSSNPTPKHTGAAHRDAAMAARLCSRSVRNNTPAARNAPAPTPPRKRYRAGCQPHTNCSSSMTSPSP